MTPTVGVDYGNVSFCPKISFFKRWRDIYHDRQNNCWIPSDWVSGVSAVLGLPDDDKGGGGDGDGPRRHLWQLGCPPWPCLLLAVNYQALVAGIKYVRKSPHCRPPSLQLKRWCICDCCVNCICKCFQTYFSPKLNFSFVNRILCLGRMARQRSYLPLGNVYEILGISHKFINIYLQFVLISNPILRSDILNL